MLATKIIIKIFHKDIFGVMAFAILYRYIC